MGNISLWGANQFSRQLFGRNADPIDTYYLALIKDVAPTAFITGIELNEPPAEYGYTRVVIPNDTDNWNVDGYHIVYNLQEATFPVATADWGRVKYWALCNTATEGYVVFYGAFVQTMVITTGAQVHIAPGMLQFAFGPIFRSLGTGGA